MFPSTVVGQVTGTGALINVTLGFLPDYVILVNRTTGAELARFRAAGTTSTRKTVVAGTITVVTAAAGIVDFTGANGEGFTIPADAQVNVNAQIIDYKAVRSGPGAD